jgi:hypothetical protein
MMNMHMNRKGISYIELIISFVMFVSFLIVLFVYLNPVKQPILSEVILSSIEQEFENNVSIILYETPFKILDSAVECFKNGTITKILIENDPNKIFIENEYGKSVNFSLTTDMLSVQNSNSPVYSIFYSNQTTFKPSLLSIPGCNDVRYVASTTRFFNIYSKRSIKKINDMYYTDYLGLKQKFDVPQFNDFAISIKNENNAPIFEMTREIPKNVIVQAREFPISILDEGTKEKIKGYINIRVW